MYNNKTRGYLSYRQFRVGPASGDYQLNISGFSGNTSDPIAGSHSLNGMKFSTRDRDNNLSTPPGYSCALQAYSRAGGLWYRGIDIAHTYILW